MVAEQSKTAKDYNEKDVKEYMKWDAINIEVNLTSGKEILKVPFVDLTNDISSVADIIRNCDLIISVDNTTAHLAAALGKPVWLLLPFNADFRWLENISTSVWYKNVTLIRQKEESDWSNEVELIYNSLKSSKINKLYE